MKFKMLLVSLLLLVITTAAVTVYLTNRNVEERLVSLEAGKKYEVGNEVVPVYYGAEFQRILQTQGNIIVYEQEDSREFIYDQSTWEWMPYVSDKKKSIVVNKLMMNTKFIINANELDLEIDENEKQLKIKLNIEKEQIKKDIRKDVEQSGIDFKKTEKGDWGTDLQAEITEQDEKSYRDELYNKEITEEQMLIVKENVIDFLNGIVEKLEVEKEIVWNKK